ncbi:30S ribosomal protein S2, partial [Salmonella enterica]|uniref:30S ribosomal protein S2 n=1 Tax=Salmonella enterica TaxID=28901 RepID=UPI00398C4D35
GGLLSNWKTVGQPIKRMKELETQVKDVTCEKLTKKDELMSTREIEKIDNRLVGIKDMGGLPDVLVVIDADHEHIAIKDANNLGIPVFAIVHTNPDPDGVDFVFPDNDADIRHVSLYRLPVLATARYGGSKTVA